MNQHFAHRSSQDSYQRCPRRWYLNYRYAGVGITKVRQAIPLARGIFVHQGLADILSGLTIDDAIKNALTSFDAECAKRGLEVSAGEDLPYVMAEQRALIEGMLYGWWLKRYPELVQRYVVLEVETEEEWRYELTEDCELVWLARADALLLEKETGDLFIQSFKTTSDWDSRKDASGNHDIQGLSELFAVEQRLRHSWEIIRGTHDRPEDRTFATVTLEEKVYRWLETQTSPPKIQGIRMEHLLCGPRKSNKRDGSGQKVQYCPLIRGYKKDGIVPSQDEFAWRFEYTDAEGGTRRLGKGWTPFNAWELPGGVREWIDRLASGMVQQECGDALDQQFVYPLPYYRQDQDVQDWKEQMIAEEWRKYDGYAYLLKANAEGGDRQVIESMLNQYFPQYRHSCDYPGPCDFIDICHSPGYKDDPIGSGMFAWRVPHHEAERAALVQIQGAK